MAQKLVTEVATVVRPVAVFLTPVLSATNFSVTPVVSLDNWVACTAVPMAPAVPNTRLRND